MSRFLPPVDGSYGNDVYMETGTNRLNDVKLPVPSLRSTYYRCSRSPFRSGVIRLGRSVCIMKIISIFFLFYTVMMCAESIYDACLTHTLLPEILSSPLNRGHI
jgi:hypothetical protein